MSQLRVRDSQLVSLSMWIVTGSGRLWVSFHVIHFRIVIPDILSHTHSKSSDHPHHDHSHKQHTHFHTSKQSYPDTQYTIYTVHTSFSYWSKTFNCTYCHFSPTAYLEPRGHELRSPVLLRHSKIFCMLWLRVLWEETDSWWW
jgi:hypothetical protein